MITKFEGYILLAMIRMAQRYKKRAFCNFNQVPKAASKLKCLCIYIFLCTYTYVRVRTHTHTHDHLVLINQKTKTKGQQDPHL